MASNVNKAASPAAAAAAPAASATGAAAAAAKPTQGILVNANGNGAAAGAKGAQVNGGGGGGGGGGGANAARPPKSNTFQSRTDEEFNFQAYTLQELLMRTSENLDEKLWKKMLKFNVDTTIFRGLDTDINTPLEELKNKKLVYSLMFHFIGRSIMNCKTVMDRYKALLNKKLRESCNEVDPIKYKAELAKLNSAKLNHTIEEIIAPHNQLGADVVHRWTQEQITWEQYVAEVSFRETVMTKLREKCSRYDVTGSPPGELLIDLLAHLHLDNFVYKRLKNMKESPNSPFLSERTIIWVMPLETEIKVEQKKSIQSSRNDYVMLKGKKDVYHKLNYIDVDKDLDPYLNGGHLKSPLLNEPNDLDYYIKRHPGKQLITELSFQMFACEVAKNPAALVYDVLISDLIDMDKMSQREILWSCDPGHSKETGRGGYLPYTFEGSATAARYLNIYYSYIFDHWYSYDMTDESEEKIISQVMNPNSEFNTKREYKIRFEEMMSREAELLEKYVYARKERDRKSRHLKTVNDLWNYLLMKVEDFYCTFPLHIKFR